MGKSDLLMLVLAYIHERHVSIRRVSNNGGEDSSIHKVNSDRSTFGTWTYLRPTFFLKTRCLIPIYLPCPLWYSETPKDILVPFFHFERSRTDLHVDENSEECLERYCDDGLKFGCPLFGGWIWQPGKNSANWGMCHCQNYCPNELRRQG